MSNLIPEVRTDKNGNAVTRWIRSLGRKTSDRTLPAPALAGRPINREPQIMELCGLLQPTAHYDSHSLLATNLKSIADKDPELLQRITSAARASAAEGDYWESTLRMTDMTRGTPEDRERKIDRFRISLDINPLLNRISNSGGDVSMNGKASHQFRRVIGTLMIESNISDPPAELTQAVTMITYIKSLHTDASWSEPDGGYTTYKMIEKDAAYIADHLDQVEGLLPELRIRKSYDRATIEMLMNSETQALREGEL